MRDVDPVELEAPPLLAQVASGLVGIGSAAGVFGLGIIIPGVNQLVWLRGMATFVAFLIGFYLTLGGLSHRYTGSWYTYPRRMKNIPD